MLSLFFSWKHTESNRLNCTVYVHHHHTHTHIHKHIQSGTEWKRVGNVGVSITRASANEQTINPAGSKNGTRNTININTPKQQQQFMHLVPKCCWSSCQQRKWCCCCWWWWPLFWLCQFGQWCTAQTMHRAQDNEREPHFLRENRNGAMGRWMGAK